MHLQNYMWLYVVVYVCPCMSIGRCVYIYMYIYEMNQRLAVHAAVLRVY